MVTAVTEAREILSGSRFVPLWPRSSVSKMAGSSRHKRQIRLKGIIMRVLTFRLSNTALLLSVQCKKVIPTHDS